VKYIYQIPIRHFFFNLKAFNYNCLKIIKKNAKSNNPIKCPIFVRFFLMFFINKKIIRHLAIFKNLFSTPKPEQPLKDNEDIYELEVIFNN